MRRINNTERFNTEARLDARYEEKGFGDWNLGALDIVESFWPTCAVLMTDIVVAVRERCK